MAHFSMKITMKNLVIHKCDALGQSSFLKWHNYKLWEKNKIKQAISIRCVGWMVTSMMLRNM